MMETRAPCPGWSSAPCGSSRATRMLPEEVAVALSLNGTTQAVMMATPDDLEDFAYRLCADRRDRRAGRDRERRGGRDRPRASTCRSGWRPRRRRGWPQRRRTMAGPVGCGLCGIDWLDEALRDAAAGDALALPMTPAQVCAAVAALPAQQRAARRHARRPCGGVLDTGGRHRRRARGCGSAQRAGQAGGRDAARRDRAARARWC